MHYMPQMNDTHYTKWQAFRTIIGLFITLYRLAQIQYQIYSFYYYCYSMWRRGNNNRRRKYDDSEFRNMNHKKHMHMPLLCHIRKIQIICAPFIQLHFTMIFLYIFYFWMVMLIIIFTDGNQRFRYNMRFIVHCKNNLFDCYRCVAFTLKMMSVFECAEAVNDCFRLSLANSRYSKH